MPARDWPSAMGTGTRAQGTGHRAQGLASLERVVPKGRVACLVAPASAAPRARWSEWFGGCLTSMDTLLLLQPAVDPLGDQAGEAGGVGALVVLVEPGGGADSGDHRAITERDG